MAPVRTTIARYVTFVTVSENLSASAQRGVARRELILNAAHELFAEHGFVLTSLPMISEKVGITHAGILHHFGSKEGVLRALLEREGSVPHFNSWVMDMAGLDVVAKLPEYAEIVIANPLAMELQFQLFWENRHPVDPMHEEVLHDIVIRDHIATQIGGVLAGQERAIEIDLQALAYNIFAFVIGANSQWLVGKDDDLLRRAYGRYTDSAVRVLMGEVSPGAADLPLA
jgi:AcrR family transcriptional regulator